MELVNTKQTRSDYAESTGSKIDSYMVRLWVVMNEMYGERWSNSMGKDPSATWRNACTHLNDNQWKRAMDAIAAGGSQYPPSLPEFLKLARGTSVDVAQARNSQKSLPKPQSAADKQVAKAWMYWLPKFHGESMGFMGKVTATPEEAEEMLILVNQQAYKQMLPDAIPDEYKLAGIWG